MWMGGCCSQLCNCFHPTATNRAVGATCEPPFVFVSETGFRAISGASVSANSLTPRTVLQLDVDDDGVGVGAGSSNLSKSGRFVNGMFESSSSTASVPVFNFVGRKEVAAMRDGTEGEGRVHECNVQWAVGKAGEDRVHVVVSEDHGWLFVGIYDGFNGPDAPEFLMANFYQAMYNELQGLFWEVDEEELEQSVNVASKNEGEVEEEMPPRSGKRRKIGPVDHQLVVNAMSKALDITEAAYLDMNNKFLDRNPDLAMTGSCLLVVLMRDEDVYVINVGDSRAIVAQSEQQLSKLNALQLSTDHNTRIEEEILRIKSEHPDDNHCIINDRVKGRLNVTRAFGAGFLKQPKLNDPLLPVFRINYIGTAPYVSCTPSLHHHKLCSNDRFLVLSSDGLYQYLTNQEVISHVESFMERCPDGNPAQHLIEELLSRAAKKAGMDIEELLNIPQGDRRKYHDDVTVLVVSLGGRIL